jgi:septal ring factor EnvC (AmiA/AmiB activator)
MAQPILKRRLNPFLLISTVAALSLLAGVSVLYQSQIADAETNVSETNQELREAQNEIQRLSLERENATRKLNNLNKSLRETEKELDTTEGELKNKTERIEELENNLAQQENSQFAGQDSREKIRNMNTSLQVLCQWGEPASEENRLSMRSACNKWGHELGG